MADNLQWGKNMGCDFVKKSCLDWIDTADKRYIFPYNFAFLVGLTSYFVERCPFVVHGSSQNSIHFTRW